MSPVLQVMPNFWRAVYILVEVNSDEKRSLKSLAMYNYVIDRCVHAKWVKFEDFRAVMPYDPLLNHLQFITICIPSLASLDTLRAILNGRHFVDNLFKLFSCMKTVAFWFELHWNPFPCAKLTIWVHWFRVSPGRTCRNRRMHLHIIMVLSGRIYSKMFHMAVFIQFRRATRFPDEISLAILNDVIMSPKGKLISWSPGPLLLT